MTHFFNTKLSTLITASLLMLSALQLKAQDRQTMQEHTKAPSQVSPGGVFDIVRDGLGNKIKLSDLAIPATTTANAGSAAKGSNTNNPIVNYGGAMGCVPGIFKIYFENGCGMENYQTNTVDADRANVVCNVLSDLSAFLGTTLKQSWNTQRVNVIVKNINNLNGIPAGTPFVGSAFYVAPSFTTNPVTNYDANDNMVWKTIISGADGFTNVAPPLSGYGNGTSANQLFYHCEIAFDFSTVNWNTNISSSAFPTATQKDLYSAVLAAMLRCMGMESQISATGAPINLNSTYSYYSRYDLYLHNNAGLSLLNHSGLAMDYNYTPSATITTALAPNCTASYITDNTNCPTSNKFIGSQNVSFVQPVYTPDCFEPYQSLNGFEDQCQTPAANNSYFVSSNILPNGIRKRQPRQAEQTMLCELGYDVAASYGNSSSLSNSLGNYTSACNHNQVVGVNDGLGATGWYMHISTGNPISFLFNTPGLTGMLDNDAFATILTDARVLVGNGTLTTFASDSFVYTPATSDNGLILISYVPRRNASSVLPQDVGNVTYVYAWVHQNYLGGCFGPYTPLPVCNMMWNGDFEMHHNEPCSVCSNPLLVYPYDCGSTQYSVYGYAAMGCWNPFTGDPRVISQGCGFNCNYSVPPCIGLSNYPNIFTWNSPTAATAFNQSYLSLQTDYTPAQVQPAIQTLLNIPIVPGHTYRIDFYYKVINGNIPAVMNYTDTVFMDIAGNSAYNLAAGSYNSSLPNQILISNLALTGANNNTSAAWDQLSLTHNGSCTFAYNGSQMINFLILALNQNNVAGQYAQILIDNVSLKEVSSFTLPSPISSNCLLHNLDQFVNVTSSGNQIQAASFSGPGVVQNGSLFDFDASSLAPGTYTIEYSYLDFSGCPIYEIANVQVTTPFTATINNGLPVSVCTGGSTLLMVNPSGGTPTFSYNWGPATGLSNTTLSASICTPTVSTVYNVVVTDAIGCSTTAFMTVNINNTVSGLVTATASPANICSGGNVAITTSPANLSSYNWTGASGLSSTTISNPTFTDVNTTGVNMPHNFFVTTIDPVSGCSVSVPLTINVYPAQAVPVITATPATSVCSGTPVTLSSSLSSGNIWTGVTSTATSVVVNASGNYSVHATNSFGCSATSAPISVAVNPTPVANAGLDQSICSPNISATITGSNGGCSTCSYSWSPAASLSAANIAAPTCTPAFTTTYTLTVTDINSNCSSTDQVKVDVNNPILCFTNFCVGSAPAGVTKVLIYPSMFIGVPYSTSNFTAYPTSFSGATNTLVINGNFTVDNNYLFSNTTIQISQGSSITIANGATLTIDFSTLQTACDKMWDKIDIQAGGTLIIQNKSVIKDMRNGIYTNNGGTYNITNSSFINNHIGINVSNLTSTNFTGVVDNCIFDRMGQLFPDWFSRIYNDSVNYGITISRVKAITIGNNLVNTGGRNIFRNIQCGISIQNAGVTINNNEFENINFHAPVYGAAIDVKELPWATATSNPINRITIGAGAIQYNNCGMMLTTPANSFRECDLSIRVDCINYPAFMATNAVSPMFCITNNEFVNATVTNMSQVQIYNTLRPILFMLNNKFTSNGVYCINMINNNLAKIGIAGNDMTMTINPYNHITNFAISEIWSNKFYTYPGMSTAPGNSFSIIRNNCIHNSSRGIQNKLNNFNTGKNVITENNIEVSAGNCGYGVFLSGNNNASVTSNVVEPFGISTTAVANAQTYGISNWLSFNSFISCNETHRFGYGLSFNGACAPGTSVQGNLLKDNLNQVEVNAGLIGVQGSSSNASYNKFKYSVYANPSAIHAETWMRNGTTGSLNQMYCDNNVAMLPANTFYTPMNNISNPSPFNFMTPSQIISTSTDPCLPISANKMSGGNASNSNNNTALNDGAVSLANGNWTAQFASNKTEATWIGQKQLYDFLMNSTTGNDEMSDEESNLFGSLMTNQTNTNTAVNETYRQNLMADNEIKTFVNGAANNAFSQFRTVDSLWNTGNLTAALEINSRIKAAVLPARLLQQANDIALNYYITPAHTFTPSQLETLTTIAYTCPLKGGAGVYLARTLLLLNDASSDNFNDVTICDEGTTPTTASAINTITNANPVQWKVMPNPATENVTVQVSNDVNANATVSILSVNGSKVLDSRQLAANETQTNFDVTGLSAGIYMCNVKLADGRNFCKPLTIVK